MRQCLALLVCALSLSLIGSAQRLPGNVVPENYQLTLTPDLSKAAFAGDEIITIRVLRPTPEIVLNAAEVDFQEASVASAGSVQQAAVKLDKQAETATLRLSSPLATGPATVHIKYAGILNNEMRGFYLGSDGQERKYAATQFEATDARRAFPSFDEPAFKATFDITLIVPKNLIALSNNRAISDSSGPGMDQHTVRFERTAKISSYLAAWVVGDFEYIKGSAEGVSIRVFTTPGKKQLGSLALKAAEYSLRYYSHYFGIKYPYGKLDLIALPDFSAGAMENVGLITSRESFLLVDSLHTAMPATKSVALTVTHEIAHQWFGDLVTMRWWDDVWLNEGFATWMEGKPVDAWNPNWNAGLDEVSRGDVLSTFGAFDVDALRTTRPVHQPAETTDQIQELFDGIAYGKAAAVLRMVETYVGPENFRAGVRAYLKQHAYANATAADFWSTLANVTKKPVDAIMPTFIEQPGIPILNVRTRCTDGQTRVEIGQRRYFDDQAEFSSDNDQLWQIPVCLKTAAARGSREKRVKCELLTKKEDTFTLPGCSQWVFANPEAAGYFRSEYQPEAMAAMARDAQNKLAPRERASLLSDMWTSVRVGRLNIGDYLAFGEGFESERTDGVLTLLFQRLQFVGDNLTTDGDRVRYQAWARSILTPIANAVAPDSSQNDSDDRKNLRAELLSAMSQVANDATAQREARRLSEQFLEDPDSLEAGLGQAALGTAARNGDAAFYERVLRAMKDAKSPERYYIYLSALSNFSDPQLLRRTLEMAISPQVRSQDALNVISAVATNPAGERAAWDFIRSHWESIEKAGGPFASAQIQLTAGTVCKADLRDEITHFFSAHEVPAAERTLRQSLEQVNNCISLKAVQSRKLEAWLDAR
jgi:aminopeptidase N